MEEYIGLRDRERMHGCSATIVKDKSDSLFWLASYPGLSERLIWCRGMTLTLHSRNSHRLLLVFARC